MTLAILDARDKEYVVVAAGTDLIATYVQQAILAGQTAQDVLDAILAAGLSEGVFPSEAAGLSGTTDGQYFWVGDGGTVTLYLNDSGTGDEIAELATAAGLALKANSADLAASTGGEMVGFLPTGTGAVPQNLYEEARRTMRLEHFLPEGFTTAGGVDYTTEIQSAMDAAVANNRRLLVGPGIFDVSGTGLLVPPGLQMQGDNQYTSILRNLNGNVLRLSGELVEMENMFFYSVSGGHVITQTGDVGRNNFSRCAFRQDDDDFSVWKNNAHQFIRQMFYGCYSQHTLTATVPTFDLEAAGGLINNNSWVDHWIQNSGQYWLRIATTTENAQYGLLVRGLVGEVCTGGAIQLQGVKNFILDDIVCWDAELGAPGDTGEVLKDFISIERGLAGAFPDGNRSTASGEISNYYRLASPLDTGVFDISLPDGGGGAAIGIRGCSSASDTIKIDLAGNQIYAVLSDAAVDLSNDSLATIQDPVTGILKLPAAAHLSVGANQVVGARVTGFTAMTGTASKAALNVWAGQSVSNPPTQAQVQLLSDLLVVTMQRLKAIDDALRDHGLLGT